MFNIVEHIADEQEAAPCKWGNIVTGHACYCHKDDWKEGPRKCPIYRSHGLSDLTKWRKAEWGRIELPMLKGYDDKGNPIVAREMRPEINDDGCPMFEVNPSFAASNERKEP